MAFRPGGSTWTRVSEIDWRATTQAVQVHPERMVRHWGASQDLLPVLLGTERMYSTSDGTAGDDHAGVDASKRASDCIEKLRFVFPVHAGTVFDRS